MFPGEEEGPVGSEGPLDRPWAPAGSVASREGPTGAGEGEKCRWEGEPGPGLVTGHLLCVHWTPAPWALRRDQRRRRQPRRPALRLPAKPGCCTRPAPPPPTPAAAGASAPPCSPSFPPRTRTRVHRCPHGACTCAHRLAHPRIRRRSLPAAPTCCPSTGRAWTWPWARPPPVCLSVCVCVSVGSLHSDWPTPPSSTAAEQKPRRGRG